jgi:hypothetical protein
LHRAELWTTHGTKLSRFVDIGRERFVVIFLGTIGIKGKLKLALEVFLILEMRGFSILSSIYASLRWHDPGSGSKSIISARSLRHP